MSNKSNMIILSNFFWDNVLTKLVSLIFSLKVAGLIISAIFVAKGIITPTVFGTIWTVIFGTREVVKLVDLKRKFKDGFTRENSQNDSGEI